MTNVQNDAYGEEMEVENMLTTIHICYGLSQRQDASASKIYFEAEANVLSLSLKIARDSKSHFNFCWF